MAFVCPECGWEEEEPAGSPPYECEPCRDGAGRVVYLQDRTPGRTVTVSCGCGFAFAVPASFAGTLRPCPRCGQKSLVPEVTSAGPAAPPVLEPAEPAAPVEKKRRRRRRVAGAGVRTFSNYSMGLGPIRVAAYGFLAVGGGLAALAVGHAAVELVTGTVERALGDLQGLVCPAILVGTGFLIRHAAYIDVWQFDPNERVVRHVRRRLRYETVDETFPFDAVTAVLLTETSSDDFSYSVDLVLGGGRTVFISNDRGHAAELALLLGVPQRKA
jgi:hypothetical protein